MASIVLGTNVMLISSRVLDRPMIPTYVQHVPDGTETGTYLALDLGGTNLRVCEVTLDGKRGHTLRQAKYTVSDELKTGEGAALFDFIAESVGGFLDDLGLRGQRLHLGFTFSFPVHQTAINKGTLLSWTKVRFASLEF